MEGTILTVFRAAAEAAEARASNPVPVPATCSPTPRRRPARRWPDARAAAVLRDAGVVDAGGRGLSVILDAAETVLTGRPTPVTAPIGAHRIPIPTSGGGDLTPEGAGVRGDVPARRRATITSATSQPGSAGLGDSLVVVGGDGLWNVHVHTDEVGAAVEAGIAAGRPHRIRVTHFAEQVDAARGRRTPTRKGRQVVAVAAGPGLAKLFEEAGATVVVGGPGNRPSTGMILEAIADSAPTR